MQTEFKWGNLLKMTTERIENYMVELHCDGFEAARTESGRNAFYIVSNSGFLSVLAMLKLWVASPDAYSVQYIYR
jgi:hypothetical protein